VVVGWQEFEIDSEGFRAGARLQPVLIILRRTHRCRSMLGRLQPCCGVRRRSAEMKASATVRGSRQLMASSMCDSPSSRSAGLHCRQSWAGKGPGHHPRTQRIRLVCC
jgi:hypothetical protein